MAGGVRSLSLGVERGKDLAADVMSPKRADVPYDRSCHS
jgi:hypothetical protein